MLGCSCREYGIHPCFVILGLLFLGAMVSIGNVEKETVGVSHNSVLYIDLATTLTDRKSNPDMQSVIYGIEEETTLLQPTLNAIKRAAFDGRISGIFIDAGPLSGGLASVYTLACAIDDFKKRIREMGHSLWRQHITVILSCRIRSYRILPESRGHGRHTRPVV